MTGNRARCLCVVAASALALALALLTPLARALEIRAPELSRGYSAELARAYMPCTVPNDVTAGGVPACSPAVTSVCTFDRGRVDIRPRLNATQLRLDVSVTNVAGPGACLTAPYMLELGLRVTADDPNCAGGQCTFQDLVLNQPLPIDPPNDLDLTVLSFESLLPGELAGSHIEILSARILGPDGLPMAAAGLDVEDADNNTITFGAGYESCSAPTTSGDLGPACAPAWPSVCDSNGGVSRWRFSSKGGPIVSVVFEDVAGPSPSCRNGVYTLTAVLRVTGPCVGAPLCTAVDYPAQVSATAKNGKLDLGNTPLSTTGAFTTMPTSVETYAIEVRDPLGDTFATAAVTSALQLRKTKATLGFGDPLDPNDDTLKLEARYPNVGIDPTQPPGVTFAISDRNGPIYTATIAGGLWQLIAPVGTRWEFADDAGGIGGIRKVSIKQFKEAGEPAGFKIKLSARDVNVSAADMANVDVVVSIPEPGGFTVTTAQRNRTCKGGARTLACR